MRTRIVESYTQKKHRNGYKKSGSLRRNLGSERGIQMRAIRRYFDGHGGPVGDSQWGLVGVLTVTGDLSVTANEGPCRWRSGRSVEFLTAMGGLSGFV